MRSLFSVSPSRRAVVASVSALIILALLISQASHAGETEPVLIPFTLEEIRNPDSKPEQRKIFVPKTHLTELMNRINPDKKEEPDSAQQLGGVPIALGSAVYELNVTQETFRATGKIQLRTFSAKDWVKLSLKSAGNQLVKVSVDGQPASIANDAGVPFVQFKGEGEHTVELELNGKVRLSAGRAQLQVGLVGGAATQLPKRRHAIDRQSSSQCRN
jgi:hypothetical protein